MKPDKKFNQEVRARLAEMLGEDRGPFVIRNISIGPEWHNITREQQVEAIARSMIPRPGLEVVEGVGWRNWKPGCGFKLDGSLPSEDF